MRSVRHTANGVRLGSAGFTMIEVLVVMGLITIMTGLVTVNLLRPQTRASTTTTVATLVTNLRSQQFRAMTGDSGDASSAQPYGVYVQAAQYTLFKGASYSAVDTENFITEAGAGVTLSTSLASSQVVFAKGTGEVVNFVGGANTITVQNTTTGDATQITINRLGVVTIL